MNLPSGIYLDFGEHLISEPYGEVLLSEEKALNRLKNNFLRDDGHRRKTMVINAGSWGGIPMIERQAGMEWDIQRGLATKINIFAYNLIVTNKRLLFIRKNGSKVFEIIRDIDYAQNRKTGIINFFNRAEKQRTFFSRYEIKIEVQHFSLDSLHKQEEHANSLQTILYKKTLYINLKKRRGRIDELLKIIGKQDDAMIAYSTNIDLLIQDFNNN